MPTAMPRRVRHSRSARAGVRPSLARVRDALFNSLAARVAGAQLLDLFAGTGSLGLEALRRGADAVVFVEQDSKLVQEIRRHLAAAGLVEQAEVRRRDVLAAIRDLGQTGRRFDVIVMDPPYGQEWIGPTLRAVLAAGILAPGGVVVAEGHWRDRPAPVPGFTLRREARYGETALWYFEESAQEGRSGTS